MKIFTNFDTENCSRTYVQKSLEYGPGKVLLVKYSFYYWVFKGILPLTVLLSIFIVYLAFGLATLHVFVDIAMITVFIFLLYFYVIKVCINYTMDFLIATPDAVYMHRQKGIFFNMFKELPSLSMRTVEVRKNSFFGNLFGFGTISLFTDIENSMEKRKASS